MVTKILIADDDETFLRSTAELLRREGYDCDCVPDVRACIENLKRSKYDLLVADIKMPGDSNSALIDELPKVTEDMPVILVTGYPSERSAIHAIELSVVVYLVKPFDFEELLEAIKAVEKTKIHLNQKS